MKLLDEMALIFLYTPHLARGIIGLIVNKKLPRSHHIIKEMQIWVYHDGHPKYDEVMKSLKGSMQSQFGMIFEDMKCLLSTYMGISVLCFMMDFILIFATLKHFGDDGKEDQELLLFFLNIIFTGCSIYWLTWGL